MPIPKGYKLDTSSSSSLPAGYKLDTPDLTDNANGEGVYEMAGSDGKKSKIPYSQVGPAFKSGLRLTPEASSTYLKDAAADPQLKDPSVGGNPQAVGRNAAGQPIVNPTSAPNPVSTFVDAFTSSAEPGGYAPLVGKNADAALTGIHNIAGRAASVVGNTLAHPIEAVKGMGAIAKDLAIDEPLETFGGEKANGPLEQRVNEFKQTYASDPAKAIENAEGDVLGMLLSGKIIDGVKSGTGDVLDKTPVGQKLTEMKSRAHEAVRRGTQTLLGAGTRKVAGEVQAAADKANTAAESVEAKNKAAEEATEKDKGVVDEKRIKQDAKHADDVREALEKREIEARKHAEKVAEVARKHGEDLKAHQDEVKATNEKNAKALIDHIAEREKISAANEAAMSTPDAIAGLEDQIRGDSEDLVKRGDQLQKDTKKEADRRYDKQRELLNDETIPPELPGEDGEEPLSDENASERIVDAYRNSITGTQGTLPKVIKSIEDRVNTGDPMTWRDYQGYRTEISRALSSGNLPGDEYWGYKNALGVVDDALEKIANDQGLGDQVRADRAFYRKYMEAFVDPAAQKVTNLVKQRLETTPDYVKEQAAKARTELYGRDPQYGVLTDAIKSARTRLDALRQGGASRSSIKPGPEVPQPTPQPKPPVEPPPPVGPVASRVAEVPNRPVPEPYKEPHPTTPVEIPEVDTSEIRNKLVERWAHGEETLNPWQVRSFIRGGIGGVAGILVGEASGLGRHITEGLGIVGATLGPALIAKLVDYPPVRNWLIKGPAGEVEALSKLPNADRIKITDGLNKVIEKAKEEGKPIQVAPNVAKALSAGAVAARPTLQELKKEAEKRKPEAPGPQSSNRDSPTELLRQARDLHSQFANSGYMPS